MSIVSSYFVLGDTDAEKIVVTDPSTIYITVGTGGDSPGGGGDDAEKDPGGGGDDTDEAPPGGGGGEDITTWYVDDDAPGDPAPGDPTTSDPAEDGSPEHPFDAIQEGIDAASNGDTVMVLDGTYTGEGNRDIEFKGKAITVQSENGPDNCIIDCGGEEEFRGFYFHNGEDSSSVLSGFKITRALHYEFAAGIYCYQASPRITGNEITVNSSYGWGGGIGCEEASPIIDNNIISENTASTGGGIYCLDSSPTITRNVITENTAPGSSFEEEGFDDELATGGGGIAVVGDSSVEISGGNLIALNLCSDGAGGGIWLYQISASNTCTIENNDILENQVRYYGGGIYCLDSPDGAVSITNHNIMKNVAMWGGGINVDLCSEDVVIANNIIVDNETYDRNQVDAHGGGIACVHSNPVIQANLIESNFSDSHGGGVACFTRDPNTTQYSPVISGNRIVDNYAMDSGGGVHCSKSSSPNLTNNTIVINGTGGLGGAFFAQQSFTGAIKNCILWDDSATTAGPEIALRASGGTPVLTVSYSDVEGGKNGVSLDAGCTLDWDDDPPPTTNLDSDPEIYNPVSGYWNNMGTPENTLDDTWVSRDYHLQTRYGRWDPVANGGEGGWILDSDFHSPCVDAGDPTSDYSSETEPNGGCINMGAFGNTAEASRSGPWWPVPGDANHDCRVNILDMLGVRNHLNQDPASGNLWMYDLNKDGNINILDMIFIRNRLNDTCQE